MSSKSLVVDQNALRFNQASIIALLAIAFVLSQPWLVLFVALVMGIGTLMPSAGLFKRLYQHVFKPLGIIRPDPQRDDPKPHLFAQGVGALCLATATAVFLAGVPAVAWALTAVVVVLAAVNLFLGFCLGCFFYYQLARRSIHADLPWWHEVRGA